MPPVAEGSEDIGAARRGTGCCPDGAASLSTVTWPLDPGESGETGRNSLLLRWELEAYQEEEIGSCGREGASEGAFLDVDLVVSFLSIPCLLQ